MVSIHCKDWNTGLDKARAWLNSSGKKTKILCEQNRNLGDTLHLTPIIRHYRILHPDAAILFIVGNRYFNAHELNPDVDCIVTVPVYEPKDRIPMRKKMLTFKELDIVCAPSIFPYAAIWKNMAFNLPNIATQYFENAGIPKREPVGGRELIVKIDDNDRRWAANFAASLKLSRNRTCAIEYHSYSDQPKWRGAHFVQFVKALNSIGIKCISFCGAKESPIAGSISAAGVDWRKTVALMNHVGAFVGIGSGMTMLAAASETKPKILEIAIPSSISMKGCGYAHSESITNLDPKYVANYVKSIL